MGSDHRPAVTGDDPNVIVLIKQFNLSFVSEKGVIDTPTCVIKHLNCNKKGQMFN